MTPGIDPTETARRVAEAAALSTGSDALGRDLGLAVLAVLLGGLEAMRFYGSTDLDVRDPTGRGPVTRADRASHEAIVDLLHERRPADAILSEEGDGSRPTEGSRRWIVDPLDGTQEFMARIGEFSVMVGLAVDGAAVLGAVYRPDPGRLYAGIADRAAWRVDNGGSASGPQPLRVELGADGLRFARSRSHPDARLQGLVDRLRPERTILSGSVGTKCALIADGEADLYVHPVPYLKEWDTCAPEAVLRGAGGRVTDCRGDPLAYGKPEPAQPYGIFAARGDIWNHVSSTIFDIGKEL